MAARRPPRPPPHFGDTGVFGEVTAIPAGGDNQPSSARLSFRTSIGTVRVIVVSAGGHAGPAVERFEITGVRDDDGSARPRAWLLGYHGPRRAQSAADRSYG
jgi:hypothetical protein